MNNEVTIWNELKEISPDLAAAGRLALPFAVPEGYFEQLPGQILALVNSATGETLPPLFTQLGREMPYPVPAGYFDQLAGHILQLVKSSGATNAAEELENLSPLLSSLNKKMPFTTPADYFSELPDSLTGGIHAVEFVNMELENYLPVFDSVKDKPLYEVPEGYFDTLAAHILAKVKEKDRKPAPVVSFYHRFPKLRYAAAALLTGVLITIGLFTFNKRNGASTDPLAGLTKVSDQEMMNYLDNHEPVADSLNATATANLELNDADIKDLLSQVPDEELEQYISERGLSQSLKTN